MTTDKDPISAATRRILERYEHELYGRRNLDLVPELLANPMWRHDAGGKVTEMTEQDCRKRIGAFFTDFSELAFRTIHLVVEGPIASWTYELTATGNDGTVSQFSSIETFEIRDGKITHVWNPELSPGPWK